MCAGLEPSINSQSLLLPPRRPPDARNSSHSHIRHSTAACFFKMLLWLESGAHLAHRHARNSSHSDICDPWTYQIDVYPRGSLIFVASVELTNRWICSVFYDDWKIQRCTPNLLSLGPCRSKCPPDGSGAHLAHRHARNFSHSNVSTRTPSLP